MDVSQPLDRRTRLTWLMVITAVVVGIDQWSKVYAVAHWKNQPTQSFWGDLFRIQYAENPGAFLSLFAGLSEQTRFWILTFFNGLLLSAVCWYLLRASNVERWTFIALSLVVAGGIGNLIDRARFGYVIDYFNLGIGDLRTGIFNVADMAISAGFIMMLPLVFRGEPKPQASADAGTTPGHQPESKF